MRLTVNSFSGAARFGFTALVYLLTYPLLVRYLGPEGFGLWALFGIVGQYMALGDLGLSSAVMKLVAEPRNESTYEVSWLAGTASVLLMCAAGVIVTSIWLLQEQILSVLRIGSLLEGDARMLLLGTACTLGLVLLGNLYSAVLSGFHRMDIANLIQAGGVSLTALGILLTVRMNYGLAGLLLTSATVALAQWVASLCVVAKITGIPWKVLPAFHWEVFRRLTRFGGYLYGASLSSMLLEPSLKIILGRYGSLAMVGNFELALRIILQLRSLFHAMLMPMLPAGSGLGTDLRQVRRLFVRSMRLLWITATPAFLLLAGLSNTLVPLWLGREIPIVSKAITMLAIGWLLNLLAVPAYLLMIALGFPRDAMLCALLQLVVACGGAWLFYPGLRFFGLIGSLGVGLGVAAIFMLARFRAVCPVPWSEILGASKGWSLAAPVFLAMGMLILSSSHYGESALVMTFAAAFSYALYVAMLYLDHGSRARLVSAYLPQSWIDRLQ
jgi:O-antigen/teichoic acid export membrane protein